MPVPLPEDWRRKLQRVEVLPEKGEWLIHLREAPDEPWEETARELAACVPGLQRVSLSFPKERPMPGGREEALTLIAEKLTAASPAVFGHLKEMESVFGEGTLTLRVGNPIIRDLWRRKEACLLLSREWEAIRGEKITVRLEEGPLPVTKLPSPSVSTITVKRVPSLNKEPIWGRPFTPGKTQRLRDLTEGGSKVEAVGLVTEVELQTTRRGFELFFFNLTDLDDSITVKIPQGKNAFPTLKPGQWVRVRGILEDDTYRRELVLVAGGLCREESPPVRVDEAPIKRVELHLHTRMSAMDAVCGAAEAVKKAAEFGHRALAITDHGVVQAFPEAWEAGQRHGVQVILGMEAYLTDHQPPFLRTAQDWAFSLEETVFTVLDVETTGLSPRVDELLEIGAVRVQGGRITGEFKSFLRPASSEIPAEITRLTGITFDMVKDAPRPCGVLSDFMAFAAGSCLVAHNATFDMGFLAGALQRAGMAPAGNPVLDTLGLARVIYPQRKSHRLDALARDLNIPLDNHHRAIDDSKATAELLLHLLGQATLRGCQTLADIPQRLAEVPIPAQRPFHAILLVTGADGLDNLYHLVSQAHLEDFHRVPRISRENLQNRRGGLLVGSACREGELWEAIQRGAGEKEIEKIAGFYDYLEIQPAHLASGSPRDGREERLCREINREIHRLGKKLGLPVVAAGDVHYLEPEDAVYREMIVQGNWGGPEGWRYYRTTEEMLEEFAYLGAEEAFRVVVENPGRIAAAVAQVPPVPEDIQGAEIPGAPEAIRELVTGRCRERYGPDLPDPVAQRLDKELEAILGNGFAGVYMIAKNLVDKSLEMGYLVGSRGSVGSSLVANLCGITEVNPLGPHYLCPACHYNRFVTDGSVASGYDLPQATCPQCGGELSKDGQDIPFETFLGFKGDKVPDIDLNFSGEAQGAVHRYAEELLGKDRVYRAGTIATVAQRTACGLVRGHLEGKGRTVREGEIRRLAAGITGVKRTTGQHPGGLMIVPEGMDIHRFTPIQRPADDVTAGTITTHFDYHAISSRLLKLDLLGHDDPTTLRLLEEYTGVAAKSIPLDDPRTLEIFSGTKPLGASQDTIGSEVGTMGIPEFGTRFVRGMLKETKPKSFGELVRISGLSHGTDVWNNNAQDLVREGTARLGNVIATRDDIMLYLIQKGLPPVRAFNIMEAVRKGKGLTGDDEREMVGNGVPPWYINSCKKISYMFPKAHAAAYCMMAFRIAWYKVHHPAAFYAAYFTVGVDHLDAGILAGGADKIGAKIGELNKNEELSAKDKGMIAVLEVAREAWARGVSLLNVDLGRSDPFCFRITPEGLVPPFVAMPGLGKAAAGTIGEARDVRPFASVDDLRRRGKATKKVLELLEQYGSLRGLAATSQLTLF